MVPSFAAHREEGWLLDGGVMNKTQRAAFLNGLPRRPSQRTRIYKALVAAEPDGLTYDDLSTLISPGTGIVNQSVATRLAELRNMGLIYRTTRTKRTRLGAMASVWRVRKHPKPPIKREKCPTCGHLMTARQSARVRR